MAKVLVVDDEFTMVQMITELLRGDGHEVVPLTNGNAAIEALDEQTPELVITDLHLEKCQTQGLDILQKARTLHPPALVIVITGFATVESAVEAMKKGAYDYLRKPFKVDDFKACVRRALSYNEAVSENMYLRRQLRDRYRFNQIVGTSPKMQAVFKLIERVADSDCTVLLLGESGTGKELVARALHADGRRRGGPFVAVNCGAFAETLLESELFGHEKGAFTGATALRKGAFERAHGGTLFLDEVGNAPPLVQVKLLRVLEEREITRVGGQTTLPVDVRLVSASNRDLEDLVAAGEFRADLLYRLQVVTLRLPPLRERREDIRPLADRFIAQACEAHGRAIAAVEPEVYAALEAYEWPGNVRQLRNVLEAAVVMATHPTLRAADLRLSEPRRSAAEKWSLPEGWTLADVEKEALLQTLRRHEGNRTLAAERLGVSRRTIQRKIREYELPF